MVEENNKIIMAENIKRYMERKGVTNQQVCDALGVKYTTFRDWIKGITYPRIGKIEAMAQYFGCKKSDLIECKADDRSRKLTDIALSEEEAALIAAYRAKSEMQNAVKTLLGLPQESIGSDAANVICSGDRAFAKKDITQG